MPRPPPARPPPTPLAHSPRRPGAVPMPQPLFTGRSSRQHPDPRVPDHATTAPPESSGQPLPSSTREQIVSERWKKPQRPWRLRRAVGAEAVGQRRSWPRRTRWGAGYGRGRGDDGQSRATLWSASRSPWSSCAASSRSTSSTTGYSFFIC
jgi:hypothetical protein